jgi:hypothetical protein
MRMYKVTNTANGKVGILSSKHLLLPFGKLTVMATLRQMGVRVKRIK